MKEETITREGVKILLEPKNRKWPNITISSSQAASNGIRMALKEIGKREIVVLQRAAVAISNE